jgi:hypothetical protein
MTKSVTRLIVRGWLPDGTSTAELGIKLKFSVKTKTFPPIGLLLWEVSNGAEVAIEFKFVRCKSNLGEPDDPEPDDPK